LIELKYHPSNIVIPYPYRRVRGCLHIPNHGAEAALSNREQDMTNPYHNFHARISPEAEKRRCRLKRMLNNCSNSELAERAFRALEACPEPMTPDLEKAGRGPAGRPHVHAFVGG
jgi:hypothetical protein